MREGFSETVQVRKQCRDCQTEFEGTIWKITADRAAKAGQTIFGHCEPCQRAAAERQRLRTMTPGREDQLPELTVPRLPPDPTADEDSPFVTVQSV